MSLVRLFKIKPVLFLNSGIIFSAVRSLGSYFHSSSTAMTVFFLENFLLMPSSSPTNSLTGTFVAKFSLCGEPLSWVTSKFTGRFLLSAISNTWFILDALRFSSGSISLIFGLLGRVLSAFAAAERLDWPVKVLSNPLLGM